ncbi:MAG: hypothetical protein ACPGWR_32525, partial [Ardenticatenaceae bacterium]
KSHRIRPHRRKRTVLGDSQIRIETVFLFARKPSTVSLGRCGFGQVCSSVCYFFRVAIIR